MHHLSPPAPAPTAGPGKCESPKTASSFHVPRQTGALSFLPLHTVTRAADLGGPRACAERPPISLSCTHPPGRLSFHRAHYKGSATGPSSKRHTRCVFLVQMSCCVTLNMTCPPSPSLFPLQLPPHPPGQSASGLSPSPSTGRNSFVFWLPRPCLDHPSPSPQHPPPLTPGPTHPSDSTAPLPRAAPTPGPQEPPDFLRKQESAEENVHGPPRHRLPALPVSPQTRTPGRK